MPRRVLNRHVGSEPGCFVRAARRGGCPKTTSKGQDTFLVLSYGAKLQDFYGLNKGGKIIFIIIAVVLNAGKNAVDELV